MATTQLAPGIYTIPLGIVNAYLIEGDGLTLMDTGVPNSAQKILDAVRGLGREPRDIKHIVSTHLHADHIGSLAAVKKVTGASAYAHPADAALIRQGIAGRPLKPAPGLLFRLLVRLSMRRGTPRADAAEIEHEIQDGDTLAFAQNIRVLHAPGHSAGHLAFLAPQQKLLFAADAAANMFGLGPAFVYEDVDVGLTSLRKLAALDFERACFGHGKPLLQNASARFRAKWL